MSPRLLGRRSPLRVLQGDQAVPQDRGAMPGFLGFINKLGFGAWGLGFRVWGLGFRV